MSNPYPDRLALLTKVLRVLVTLNLLMGVFITALLIATLVVEGPVMRGLGVRAAASGSRLFFGIRLIMAIGICTVPVVHFVSQRLLMIVATVRIGNPFIVVNAARLRAIAWALLALDLMHFAVGATGSALSSGAFPVHLSWGFSITRYFAVILLFVLARVFEQGARMREDLEGTV